MTKSWKILDEHYYEKFHLFSIKRSRRENPRTGIPFDFFLMNGLDWTTVIVLTRRNEIVLVEQYRHGANKLTLELPGGAVEKGESPIDAAARELNEETGFTLSKIESLGSIYTNPAMQSMKLHVFLGFTDDLVPAAQQLDTGEDIRIIVKPLDEFLNDVKECRAEHALTTAAVGLYLLGTRAQPPSCDLDPGDQ